jgi:hypothetical protein
VAIATFDPAAGAALAAAGFALADGEVVFAAVRVALGFCGSARAAGA